MNDHTSEELVRVTNEFVRAIVSNDPAQLDACLAEDWALVAPDAAGPISREQFLGAVRGGVLRHDTMKLDVIRIKVYGDVAVVTGRGTNTGAFKGAPMQADEWATDIYRKTDGRWRCVLTQLTPVNNA